MKNIAIILSVFSLVVANNADHTKATDVQKEVMQIIWQQAMEAKELYKNIILIGVKNHRFVVLLNFSHSNL